MSHGDQQIDYFRVPRGFTGARRINRLRRMGIAPDTVIAWYVQLHEVAKYARSFGAFSTDVEQWEQRRGCDIPEPDEGYYEWFRERVKTWRAFEAVGLVEIDGDVSDLDQGFRVTFTETDEVQVRQLTEDEKRERDARRKRIQRAAKKAGVSVEEYTSSASADILDTTPQSYPHAGFSEAVNSSRTKHADLQACPDVSEMSQDASACPPNTHTDTPTHTPTTSKEEADTSDSPYQKIANWSYEVADALPSLNRQNDPAKRDVLREEIYNHASRNSQTREAYLRAAAAFEAKVNKVGANGERWAPTGSPMGYFFSTILSNSVEVTVEPEKVENPDARRLREFMETNGVAS